MEKEWYPCPCCHGNGGTTSGPMPDHKSIIDGLLQQNPNSNQRDKDERTEIDYQTLQLNRQNKAFKDKKDFEDNEK